MLSCLNHSSHVHRALHRRCLLPERSAACCRGSFPNTSRSGVMMRRGAALAAAGPRNKPGHSRWQSAAVHLLETHSQLAGTHWEQAAAQGQARGQAAAQAHAAAQTPHLGPTKGPTQLGRAAARARAATGVAGSSSACQAILVQQMPRPAVLAGATRCSASLRCSPTCSPPKLSLFARLCTWMDHAEMRATQGGAGASGTQVASLQQLAQQLTAVPAHDRLRDRPAAGLVVVLSPRGSAGVAVSQMWQATVERSSHGLCFVDPPMYMYTGLQDQVGSTMLMLSCTSCLSCWG